MIRTYNEALQFLYENLPMFQRVGASAYNRDLANTYLLCESLGNPQNRFPSIHIGGTNGKGSTSHMLASVLQSAGYRTGLYTSPHLKEFTERIKVNGKEISQEYVVDFVNFMHASIFKIRPSFFEITVAMAFDYFAVQKVDVAVIEVGLGGRLDSTNIITPVVSVITNIGWDHKDLLGNTLPAIASEKAGIIKDRIPVVVSERQLEVEDVFINKAAETKSTLYFASDIYSSDSVIQDGVTFFNIKKNEDASITGIKLPLQGLYQRKNLPAVFAAVDVLNMSHFSISSEAIQDGLENVVEQTGLKGRWQKLNTKPLVVCDTGHNQDGIREVVHQIKQQKYDKLYIVWGMVKDKDTEDILRLLPQEAYYYFCQADIPRALDAALLADKARQLGLHGEVVKDVNEAKTRALRNAAEADFIFIGGSTFVVAEIEGL